MLTKCVGKDTATHLISPFAFLKCLIIHSLKEITALQFSRTKMTLKVFIFNKYKKGEKN